MVQEMLSICVRRSNMICSGEVEKWTLNHVWNIFNISPYLFRIFSPYLHRLFRSHRFFRSQKHHSTHREKKVILVKAQSLLGCWSNSSFRPYFQNAFTFYQNWHTICFMGFIVWSTSYHCLFVSSFSQIMHIQRCGILINAVHSFGVCKKTTLLLFVCFCQIWTFFRWEEKQFRLDCDTCLLFVFFS